MTESYENWVEKALGIPIYSSKMLKPNQALVLNLDSMGVLNSTFFPMNDPYAKAKAKEAERKREWRIRAGLIDR